MALTLTFSGELLYPADEAADNAPVPLSFAGTYASKVVYRLALGAGAPDRVIDISDSGLGATAILIEVASTPVSACMVSFNGGTDMLEIRSGGFLFYANPGPTVAGITEILIAHMAPVVVNVHVFSAEELGAP